MPRPCDPDRTRVSGAPDLGRTRLFVAAYPWCVAARGSSLRTPWLTAPDRCVRLLSHTLVSLRPSRRTTAQKTHSFAKASKTVLVRRRVGRSRCGSLQAALLQRVRPFKPIG